MNILHGSISLDGIKLKKFHKIRTVLSKNHGDQ